MANVTAVFVMDEILDDSVVTDEEHSVATAAQERLGGTAHRTLICPNNKWQLAVTRDQLGRRFRGCGGNLTVRENILCGL